MSRLFIKPLMKNNGEKQREFLEKGDDDCGGKIVRVNPENYGFSFKAYAIPENDKPPSISPNKDILVSSKLDLKSA